MKQIIRSTKHLNFIRSLPCYISEQTPSQACHIRILSDGGTGLKPSDYFTLPFTYQYHKMQTDLGEQSFYAKFNINPFIVAKDLVIISPCNKVNNEAVIKQLEEGAKTYARIYQDQ
jgi:hypothetical protein